MRGDITKIVCSLIQNIGNVKDDFDLEIVNKMAGRVSGGIDVLKDNWPNLTETEKQELAAVALTIKSIYLENNKSYKKTL